MFALLTPVSQAAQIEAVVKTVPNTSSAFAERTMGGNYVEFHINRDEIARYGLTVGAVQDVYRRNVFPAMSVTWGSYPNNLGHITSNGCMRCHDDSHEAKDGSKISGDCEYCHKQLETPS